METKTIVPPNPREQPQRSKSLLAYALDAIDDGTLHRVKAVGVVSGVVVACVLGIPVGSAYCVHLRSDGVAGRVQTQFAGDII
ncbi:hypothetical protein [Nocardiopsis synnemataformans]|uniref:hypothetical protein n=1 Tax=Nocardiopsis synnemataformans TaxID=61305 RepID=UPI003EBF2E11